MEDDKFGIISPKDGWKEECFYVVEVKVSRHNLLHKSLFYSGFLDSIGVPAGYNQVINPTYEYPIELQEIYYLKVIEELGQLLS
jgi:hypothetical protein